MTVEELAKEYTEEAFNKLAELMQSDSPKMALEAATQILDRGHGKSVDRVAIQSVGAGQGRVEDMSTEQILQAMQHRIEQDEPILTVNLQKDED